MALFNITIERVVIKYDDAEIKKLLQAIESKIDKLLEDPDGEIKQEIMDKLNDLNENIKATV